MDPKTSKAITDMRANIAKAIAECDTVADDVYVVVATNLDNAPVRLGADKRLGLWGGEILTVATLPRAMGYKRAIAGRMGLDALVAVMRGSAWKASRVRHLQRTIELLQAEAV